MAYAPLIHTARVATAGGGYPHSDFERSQGAKRSIMAAAAAAAPAATNEEEPLGFFERMGRIVAPVEAPLPPPVPPSQSLLGSLAQYVAPDPTAAAAADGGARIEEGVEESTEPPVGLRLDNCTVSRAAERLLIELAIDMAAAPDADPAKRCRAYLDEHYPATTAST